MKIFKIYKKILTWLVKDSSGLNKKWWHRFLKVLFIISIISISIYTIKLLVNSYPMTVNQWNFVDSLEGRLSDINHSDKVFSIKQLYSGDEVIIEGSIYSVGYFPNLKNNNSLLPNSPVFIETAESFCSDNLDKKIKEIADENNVKLFSATNPTINTLSSDIDTFILYLNKNNIDCTMIDSYTIENDDGTTSKYTFLRAVDVNEYYVSQYENNFIEFVLNIFIEIIGLLLYIFVVLFVYNKIILYIIYGNKKSIQ